MITTLPEPLQRISAGATPTSPQAQLEAITSQKPYSHSSVAKYKAKQVKANTKIVFSFNPLITLFAAMLSALTALFAFEMPRPSLSWIDGFDILAIGQMVGYGLTMAFLVIGSGWLLIVGTLARDTASWAEVPWAYRKDDCPPTVQLLATEIQEQIPSARLDVDELRSQRNRLLDPFLVVKIKGERFYVAVWDEDFVAT